MCSNQVHAVVWREMVMWAAETTAHLHVAEMGVAVTLPHVWSVAKGSAALESMAVEETQAVLYSVRGVARVKEKKAESSCRAEKVGAEERKAYVASASTDAALQMQPAREGCVIAVFLAVESSAKVKNSGM